MIEVYSEGEFACIDVGFEQVTVGEGGANVEGFEQFKEAFFDCCV